MQLLKQVNDGESCGPSSIISPDHVTTVSPNSISERKPREAPVSKLEQELAAIRTNILATSSRNRLINLRESSPFVVNLNGNKPHLLLERLNANGGGLVLRGTKAPKDQNTAQPALQPLDRNETASEFDPATEDCLGVDSPESGTADIHLTAVNRDDFSQEAKSSAEALAEGADITSELTDSSERDVASAVVKESPGDGRDSALDADALAGDTIATSDTETALKSNLTSLKNQAHRDRDDKGVHSLYLVLGFLNWKDDKGKQMRSPLVTIPVSLEQRRGSAYRLKKADLPLERNEALAVMLKSQFDIDLPEISADQVFSFAAYLGAVRNAVGLHDISIDGTSSALATLSFDRVLLHRDLDSNRWPEGKKLEENPVVSCIFGGAAAPGTGPSFNSEVKSLIDIPLVFEADGSQIDAIYRAVWGENLVIQGPPGTGKSQTITNIIGGLRAKGKKLLVVSEKAAAVAVIVEKLERVGLGDQVLNLHAEDLSRSLIIESINRALHQGTPQKVDLGAVKRRMAMLENKIANHENLVSSPIGDRGVSLHEAIGEMSRLAATPGVASLDLSDRGVEALSGEKYERCIALSDSLASLLKGASGIEQNPLFDSNADTEVLEHKKGSARNALNASLAQLHACQRDLASFCEEIKISADSSIAALQQVVLALRELGAVEGAMGGAVLVSSRHDEWAKRLHKLAEYGKLLEAQGILKEKWGERLREEAWVCSDVEALQQGVAKLLDPHASKLLQLLSPSMWRIKRSVQRLYQQGKCPAPTEWAEALKDIDLFQRIKEAMESPDRQSLFEHAELHGAKEDLSTLSSIVNFSSRFLAKHGKSGCFQELVNFMHAQDSSGREAVYKSGQTAEKALVNIEEEVRKCADTGGLNPDVEVSAIQASSVAYSVERCGELASRYGDLNTVVRINRVLAKLRELGVKITKDDVRLWGCGVSGLTASIKQAWLGKVIEEQWNRSTSLQSGAQEITKLIREYMYAAQELFAANAQTIALEHFRRLPTSLSIGQAEVLGKEISKRGSHLPIRTLFQEAGAAVQAVKPIVMASPASVARFISPDAPVDFDVVIIDEASQMRPGDALGLLGRARQAVIVGDLNQMPPSRSFESKANGTAPSSRADVESILALASQAGIGKVMLRHHRRSMDPSLISLASKLLYHEELLAFPSPRVGAKDEGLTYRKIENGVYARGKSTTNQAEAEAVVEAVIEHARTYPNRTLGVVAFNKNQAQLIQKLLSRELAQLDDTSGWKRVLLDPHGQQPLFIRSLENVQGDERDSIFVSVGFGKDEQGRFTFNFGPLAEAGGERRLNVLMTRARWECRIFSSIEPEQLGGDDKPLGVQHLRRYLEAARDRQEHASAVATGARRETAAQELMRMALERHGYVVDTNVGRDGVVVDLAVRSEQVPDRYIAGILFDGAQDTRAHAGGLKTERLTWMPAELRQRGWRIVPVWTRDLMTDRQSVVDKILSILQEELDKDPQSVNEMTPEAIQPTKRETVSRSTTPLLQSSYVVIPYTECKPNWPATLSLQNAQPNVVAKVLADVVGVEAPIHRDEVLNRLLNGSRSCSQLEEKFAVGLKAAVDRKLVQQIGDFLHKPGSADSVVPVRQRTRGAANSKSLALVSTEELIAAMDLAVKQSYGIKREEMAEQVMKTLGVKDASKQAASRVHAMLERQLEINRYTSRSSWILWGK